VGEVTSRNLADGPGFDNMVIGALTRLGQTTPSEIVRNLRVYGTCTHQAVTAALYRDPAAKRHPTGTWSVRRG
jgi:hypothetical protein